MFPQSKAHIVLALQPVEITEKFSASIQTIQWRVPWGKGDNFAAGVYNSFSKYIFLYKDRNMIPEGDRINLRG